MQLTVIAGISRCCCSNCSREVAKSMTKVREGSGASGGRKEVFVTPCCLEMRVGWDGMVVVGTDGLGSHKVDDGVGALLFFSVDLGKIKEVETKYSRPLS